ncbi:MAG: RNA polymerase sigma factor [Longimicrobiales bacterium]
MDPSGLTRRELEAELERLHQASFGWASSCCGWNDADAEDVLQTTYMKVISGRARFGGRSAFRTWLFGVIRQTAWEHARRARSHERRAERLAVESPAAEAESADASAERSERSRALLGALAELPDRQREVLHLVFYQDLTIREAAEVMEVSLGSARVHYERGKKRLRGLLAAENEGGGSA